MIDKKLFCFLPALVVIITGFSISAQTQDQPQTKPTEKVEDKGIGVESDDDEEVEAESPNDDSDAVTDEEDDNDEVQSEKMQLTPPRSFELDMNALGQMDPEKELSDNSKPEKADSKPLDRDWTERAMDILELHGYFRVRPELYHKFNIRNDDAVYNQTMAQRIGSNSYKNNTLAGANMRFRLEPTLNISEDIRIKSQMDFLDNVMMGSTPRYWQGYVGSGFENNPQTIDMGRVQGWDMGPPDSSQMLVVRRVWGEVKTPFGHLRFGRMGDDFGLGMLHNSGNSLQGDFGDSVDRILFAAKINDWLIMPAFDFPNEGMSSSDASGRPFDVSQLDDSYRILGVFGYIHNEQDQLAMLRRGDWLINTALRFSYQWQVMSFENDTQSTGIYNPDSDPVGGGETPYSFYKREMWQITPNFWLQFLSGTFHLEMEAAMIFGKIGNPDRAVSDEINPLTLLQWGMVLQIDYGLLADALRLGLEFGYAQGDKDVDGLRAPSTFDQTNPENTKFTAFSFNPAYDMDLILHKHILGSVSQNMYLKAWVNYDFFKNPMGRNLSIRADVIYSRAIFEESTIGKSSTNLGVELNAQVLYRSQDRFYAGLAYGVLFPLGAFKGDPDDVDGLAYGSDTDLTIPQTVQTILGITF